MCACGLPVPDASGYICLGQRRVGIAGSGVCLNRGALSAVGVDRPLSMRMDGAVLT